MASTRVFLNLFRGKFAIMASKTAIRASKIASQQKVSAYVQSPTTKLSKIMKNVKDWKSTLGETKWTIVFEGQTKKQ
jgi:hypothetical protein